MATKAKHRKVASSLKIHGGKHYLATKIADIADRISHMHYLEAYYGGGSVLLAKKFEGISEVANDINPGLMSYWKVMKSPTLFGAFRRMVEATPFSKQEWEVALANLELNHVSTDSAQNVVGYAYDYFVACRQSMSGRMTSFSPVSRNRTRRGMNEQVSAWLTSVEGLSDVHARLQRVLLLNIDALEAIRQQDGVSTLVYCDPPYLPETRTAVDVYEYEMTPEQHQELLDTLAGMKGKFLLSGYRSELYDKFAEVRGWKRFDFEIANHAASGDTKRRMTECLWTNETSLT